MNDGTDQLDLAWEKWLATSNDVENFKVINSVNVFKERLRELIPTVTDKDLIYATLYNDYDMFLKILNMFDDYRYKCMKSNNGTTESCIANMRLDGMHKIENLYTESELTDLTNFCDVVENHLGHNISPGGKLHVTVNASGQITSLHNNKSMPNHGELRCQSKSLGCHPPGVEKLAKNLLVDEVCKTWLNSDKGGIWRSTLSWLSPAPATHIGWHIDSIYDVIKVMILLTDVELINGPMYFIKGSHRLNDNAVSRYKHRIFKWSPTESPAPRLPENAIINDPDPATIDDVTPVKLNNEELPKLVATGKRGDAIFFETSAFHSGNRALSMRKTVILSTPTKDTTFKNIFLEYIGYPRKLSDIPT